MSFQLKPGEIRSFLRLAIAGSALACFGANLIWAQATSTSTVAGQVTDQQNAAIAGVEVKLVDTATSEALTTITNETGRYVFVNVAAGTYNAVFSKAGFSVFRIAAQQVGVGETLTVNATLSVGSTTTTVEVRATATAELQTTSATVANTITQESILHLPNLGRDVQTLAVLQPGVTS
ncbi:MAG TPA: carboxypeptidase-like regulatory domain-containing protein, partial [Methylomirabilota bacterium]|nr:carboxypeptidase-like regulatory domain-containing protein [Methylomirabilota bacterium]